MRTTTGFWVAAALVLLGVAPAIRGHEQPAPAAGARVAALLERPGEAAFMFVRHFDTTQGRARADLLVLGNAAGRAGVAGSGLTGDEAKGLLGCLLALRYFDRADEVAGDDNPALPAAGEFIELVVRGPGGARFSGSLGTGDPLNQALDVLVRALTPATAGRFNAALRPAPPLSEGERAATEVACRWASWLLGGDVAKTAALSDVPFTWDGKTLEPDPGALRARLAGVVGNKGVRDIPVDRGDLLRGAEAEGALKGNYLGGEAGILVVRVMVQGESVTVFVRPGEAPKVVGFRD